MNRITQLVTTTTVAFFGEASILSNFYRCPLGVEYGNYLYNTSEHAFMAAKATHFGDVSILTQIRYASDVGTSALVAKRLGRVVQGLEKEEWDLVKVDIMYSILLSKFTRDPSLSTDLLNLYSKGSRKFVEASPYDTEWGCGLPITSPDLDQYSKHKGRNLMGRLLDQVAEQLCGITITGEPRSKRIRRSAKFMRPTMSNSELQELIEHSNRYKGSTYDFCIVDDIK